MNALLLWLILINLAAFALMGADKRRAKRGQWRVPEHTLLTAAVMGGSPGAILGMEVFRHKTRHAKFAVGLPLILCAQLLLLWWMGRRGWISPVIQ